MNTSYPLLPLGPPFNMSNFDYQIINYQITFITEISSKLFDHVYALQYFTDIISQLDLFFQYSKN